MNKYFPYMTDRPDTQQVVIGGIYWVAYLIFLPGIFRLLALAIVPDSTGIAIFFNLYFLINFLVIFSIFRKYLSDSYWNVRLHKKECAKCIFSGFIAFLLLTLPVIGVCVFFYPENLDILLCAFPIADSFMQYPVIYLLSISPLMSICSFLILIPVTTSCLYYGVFFAPLWEKKPAYGYLSVALLSALPYLIATFGAEQFEFGLICWALRLPIHMCACWVYQRTNTIWGSIFLHFLVNLLSIICSILLWIILSLQILSFF